MARNRSHDGVHATHCCWLHGCKYCDSDCPVKTGEIKQAYACEDCQEDGWSETPPQELKEIEKLVDKWMERWFNDEEEAVAKEIYDQRNPTAVFWFVGKLGACHRLGSVWKMVQMVNRLEGRDQ
jgi:hypothetical protein